MTPELRQRLIKSLQWMVDVFKWQHDETGVEGNYSDELKEAIALLDELKAGQ